VLVGHFSHRNRVWIRFNEFCATVCALQVHEARRMRGGIEIAPPCGLVPARRVTVARIMAAGRGSRLRMRSTEKRSASAFRIADREDRSAWPMTRLLLVEKGACRATSENACLMTLARVSQARGRGRTRRPDPTFSIPAVDRQPRKSSVAILPMCASAPRASPAFSKICFQPGGLSMPVRRLRASGRGAAVGFAMHWEAWRPFDVREEAEALFFGAARR
jgi:hypothetical protein